MATIMISQDRIDAALDRALADGDVRESLQEAVRIRLEDVNLGVEELIKEQVGKQGNVIERWLDRHRDEIIDRVAEKIISFLFSDPGGPGLFRKEILNAVADHIEVEVPDM